MKHFKSKYILRPFVLYTTIAIVVLADLVLSKHIAEEYIQIFELSLIFVYIVIFIWTYFNMLFKSFDEFDIANEIFALEKEKKIKEIRWEKFEKSTLLLDYKIAHEELKKSNLFIHFLRSKEDITHENNLGAYISIILILGISQYSFDYLKPIGPIIYISIIFTYLALCIRILIWEGIERKNFISPINIGHIIVISILFLFGKGTYIRNYGKEIIGSFFEKAEYKTQYFVNLFPDESSSKNYRLPAEIHVYSHNEEETGEDRFGNEINESSSSRHINLIKVLWPNGGLSYFDDCQLIMGEKILCSDQEGRDWYIELTHDKVH